MKNQILTSIILGIVLCISSCSKKADTEIKFIDEDQRLLIGLEKFTQENYSDHSYNYDFEILKEKTNKDFYKIADFESTYSCIPSVMKNKLHIPSRGTFPFDTKTQKANIVSSWIGRDLVFQVQFSFFANENYSSNFKDYFCITVSQHQENPFATEEKRDYYLEKINKYIDKKYTHFYIEDDQIVFKTINNKEWPKNYANYETEKIDGAEEKLQLVSKNATQYYTWHNGLIYHIGYRITDTSNFNADEVIKSIILGK